jgi:hypothetical protein
MFPNNNQQEVNIAHHVRRVNEVPAMHLLCSIPNTKGIDKSFGRIQGKSHIDIIF